MCIFHCLLLASFTSWPQPGPDGARSTSLQSCGSTKAGMAAELARAPALRRALPGDVEADDEVSLRAFQTAAAERLPRLMNGVGARPVPAAICCSVRLDATDLGSASSAS